MSELAEPLYAVGTPVKLRTTLLAFGNIISEGWPGEYRGPKSRFLHLVTVKDQSGTRAENLPVLSGDIEPRFPMLQREFKDFDLATLPAIPWTWQESSWHNDACPSFTIGDTLGSGEGIQVFVDYHDPQQSEFPELRVNGGFRRFNAQSINSDGDRADIASSNDWNDILAAVIAWAFYLNLRNSFSPAAFEAMQQANVGITEGVCASHDFCDANMPMSDAFEAVMGRPPLVAPDGTQAHEDDCKLWSAAWNIATPLYLTAKD